MRLRCERCQGPVFLEDATGMMQTRPAAERKGQTSGKNVERGGVKAA
jgi:hypothetical protein